MTNNSNLLMLLLMAFGFAAATAANAYAQDGSEEWRQTFRVGWLGPAAETNENAARLVIKMLRADQIELTARPWADESDPYEVLGLSAVLSDSKASSELAREICALNAQNCRIKAENDPLCRYGACWAKKRPSLWDAISGFGRKNSCPLNETSGESGAHMICGPNIDFRVDAEDTRFTPISAARDAVETAIALGGCERDAQRQGGRRKCLDLIVAHNSQNAVDLSAVSSEDVPLFIPVRRLALKLVARDAEGVATTLRDKAATLPGGTPTSPSAKFNYYSPVENDPQAFQENESSYRGDEAVLRRHPNFENCAVEDIGRFDADSRCRFMNYDALAAMRFPFDIFDNGADSNINSLAALHSWVIDVYPDALRHHCAFLPDRFIPSLLPTPAHFDVNCDFKRYADYGSGEAFGERSHGYAMSGIISGFIRPNSQERRAVLIGTAPASNLSFVQSHNNAFASDILAELGNIDTPKIVNASFRRPTRQPRQGFVCGIFTSNKFRNTLLVASAGNNGQDLTASCDVFPGCHAVFETHRLACEAGSAAEQYTPSRVVSVAATDISGRKALATSDGRVTTNYGRSIDVAAVGVAFAPAYPSLDAESGKAEHAMLRVTGSSPASAYVSSLALLLWAGFEPTGGLIHSDGIRRTGCLANDELSAMPGRRQLEMDRAVQNRTYWARARILASADYWTETGAPYIEQINGVPISQFGLVNYSRALSFRQDQFVLRGETATRASVIDNRERLRLKLFKDPETKVVTVKSREGDTYRNAGWLDAIHDDLDNSSSDILRTINFDQVLRLQQSDNGKWRIVFIENSSDELVHIENLSDVGVENAGGNPADLRAGNLSFPSSLHTLKDFTARALVYPCNLWADE